MCVPHSVEDGPVLHDSEESVGCRHVVSHGSFPVPEEGVGGPDFGHHEIIEAEDLHRTFILQASVHPRLTEEHVHGVFLKKTNSLKPDTD